MRNKKIKKIKGWAIKDNSWLDLNEIYFQIFNTEEEAEKIANKLRKKEKNHLVKVVPVEIKLLSPNKK